MEKAEKTPEETAKKKVMKPLMKFRLLPIYWKIILALFVAIVIGYGATSLFLMPSDMGVWAGSFLWILVVWFEINMWLPINEEQE